MRRNWLSLAIAIPLVAAPAGAPAQSTANGGAPALSLAPADLDPARLLPPPPPRGSAAEQRELAELHAIIAAASPAQQAQTKADDRNETPSIFDAAIGSGFQARQLPTTWALLTGVQREADAVANRAKLYFARTRPWGVDPTLIPCDAKPGKQPTRSYPSGHAMLGYSVGLVLAELIPAKAPQILARASDYGFEREICAAHFPSDVEASHALAAIVVTRLLAVPAWRDRVEAARTELRAAGVVAR